MNDAPWWSMDEECELIARRYEQVRVVVRSPLFGLSE